MTGTAVELRAPGIEVDVVELGARLARLRVPDRCGVLADVVLGLDGYQRDRDYLGATVGRFANRIAGGRFELDGHRYAVPCNEDGVALHGGPDGFDRQVFRVDPVTLATGGGRTVTLRRISRDGENGFPGNLEVAVTYAVAPGELRVELTARTDRPTVVNLTNHAYWNLSGRAGSVEDHRLSIAASRYLPVDGRLLPTGELAPVAGTPFDLRRPVRLGDRLRAGHPQLLTARGFDHTFVLDAPAPDVPAVHVAEPTSGRTLTLHTDRPGVQFYSGNALDGHLVLRDGRTARQSDAFCLEPQHFPDSPNRPAFPSTVLRPGERYRATTVLRFGVCGSG